MSAATATGGPEPVGGSPDSAVRERDGADGVLAGVRVLDLSRYLAGPVAGRVLADLGAEVIKVEPLTGDPARSVLPKVEGASSYFVQHNAGKQCVSIDIRTKSGAGLLRRLVAESDVLLENFRPDVMQRLGLGAEELMATNPRLIYCSVSGYGQSGTWAGRGAFAPLVHAETGVLELAARRKSQASGNDRAVEPETHSHGDVYPAMAVALALLAALLERHQSGVGRRIDVSMAEALFYVNEWAAVEMAGGGSVRQLFGAWNSPILRLSTGVQVAFPGNPMFNFDKWAEAMGRPELLDDPRFCDPEARTAHRDEVMTVLQEFIGSFDSVSAVEAALRRVRIHVGQVRTVTEFAAGEWAADRDVVTEVQGIRVPRAPWRWDGPPVGARTGVGALGSDTEKVLGRVLGLNPQEIASLAEEGAIGLSLRPGG